MADQQKDQTLSINGKEYALESLGDEAKTQLMNIKAADNEISRLNMQLALAQTARNAYARALSELLPE